MRSTAKMTIEQSIKINKFVPRKPNYKDEQFYYAGIWWNVSSMLEYIEAKGLQPREYAMVQLRTANDLVEVDHEYALTTDLSKPGIIIQLTREHSLMVDGHHRLYRAIVESRSTYPAYYLSLDEQIHFITDRDGLNRLNSFRKLSGQPFNNGEREDLRWNRYN
ncbi:hypothetical protein EHV15_34180 [Paenibacillus oralis]|uniref:ParB/Sulfiredoxin domain-containing protein n=1 Tax=Paenibacillus oralis TaxID=2490856 RepID=A0A3P3T9E6_9BACL|nr:hypothetical protein [Paenibacillus oralis]RRJ54647.1 hypothetical protein EHV15_34180 [Paenibacillus oralis]